MREVFFGRRKVEKEFSKLDSYTQKRVAKAIEEIRENPQVGILLTGDLAGYFKYKFGKFRAVYSYDEEKIMIVALDTRDDVYDEIKRYIREVGKIQVSAKKAVDD
ncbi:cytotoxic translational repressor of toxin-antitoxin stability system [Candidatus Nitrososphaera evergladensis SR1]|uniref:Cytotoxic translational repressor of toxin-antitoxin stability system n=1 Tax=Candidatus Nitrososphaera evergladensis SR1 TaxID=1459636 RepID=A0A075MSP1_9ARCH|nr:type II toxin-antitoxin system RelE/ParE family toxin [Candidatus Nitrososphaera evergladensis]AIF82369.1 cytotoxic translational repressor of toxin-antitoxin stability system [Candidatus Nitrososphaera evergladensis SR1]AIF83214.1 cytotoxic translational repressor of toxin-antitoxin stability system [Candidatus Nitrososphaera evergladensis SR1]